MNAVVEANLLKKLLQALGRPPVMLRLWDGTEVTASDTPPIAGVAIADRRALLGLMRDPQLKFGELYTAGRVTVEGDLAQLLEAVHRSRARSGSGTPSAKKWAGRPTRNTRLRAQRNARHHYDLGHTFYTLWLDESLTYSCAYFASPALTLAEAQAAKIDHIARKLRLKPGHTVVEIGSGWGSLALRFAKHWGVRVHGINVSPRQLEYSRRQAAAAGLSKQVQFIEADYRNLEGRYDAVVSVGMLEHVGLAHYPEFGQVIARCLKPGGLGLIQSIGRDRPAPVNPWIARYIFPGGYVPSLGEMQRIFEAGVCSVLDVENLRLHYARTLEYWRANFARSRAEVVRMFDENFARLWEFYLAGSAAAFRAGQMQLFQVLFTPSGNDTLPWTRADLYVQDSRAT